MLIKSADDGQAVLRILHELLARPGLDTETRRRIDSEIRLSMRAHEIWVNLSTLIPNMRPEHVRWLDVDTVDTRRPARAGPVKRPPSTTGAA
jgi:hypothetical protein